MRARAGAGAGAGACARVRMCAGAGVCAGVCAGVRARVTSLGPSPYAEMIPIPKPMGGLGKNDSHSQVWANC